jgi:hypothetical protein
MDIVPLREPYRQEDGAAHFLPGKFPPSRERVASSLRSLVGSENTLEQSPTGLALKGYAALTSMPAPTGSWAV